MKKKGFTLVELLAVIVVLGIIALIGYASIGNVINSSKESSNKVTIKNYAKAIEQIVFLSNMNDEEVNLDSSEWIEEKVKFENSKVVCNHIIYDKSASLYGCKVNDSIEEYCYNNNEAYTCGKSKNLFDGKFPNMVGLYLVTNKLIDGNLSFSMTEKDPTVDISGIYLALSSSNTHPYDTYIILDGTVRKTVVNNFSNYKYLALYPATQEAVDKVNARFNIQIEEGSTATDYEAYGYKKIEN